jgi:hypothetical protein
MKYLVVLLSMCLVATAFAQPARDPAWAREAFQAAAQSLTSFQAMVTDQNFRQMGFSSPGEVKTATLGPPLPVFMVRLDDLRAYRPGPDAGTLLRDLHKTIYPVLVNDHVRSSITVERRDNRWQGTSFGAPKLAGLTERARRASSSARGVSPDSYVLVHVAALNRYYLGHRSDGKLMLTMIVDDPALKLSVGQEVAAENAFQTLVPIAQQHDGRPS